MNRTLVGAFCLIAVILGWFGYSRVASHPASASASPSALPAPQSPGEKIYFIPLGDFPTDQLRSLVDYYLQKLNVEVSVLEPVALDPSARDDVRRQFIAEKLAGGLRNAISAQQIEAGAILIGFTSEDIYPVSQNWAFAFGWRLGNARSAVVSTARMSPHYDGEPVEATAETRLRKVVTKDIGLLYFGLPQSNNPRSVLYNQIMGIQELDQVGDDF